MIDIDKMNAEEFEDFAENWFTWEEFEWLLDGLKEITIDGFTFGDTIEAKGELRWAREIVPDNAKLQFEETLTKLQRIHEEFDNNEQSVQLLAGVYDLDEAKKRIKELLEHRTLMNTFKFTIKNTIRKIKRTCRDIRWAIYFKASK